MINLVYLHDIPVDALSVKLFDGSGLVATVVMEAVADGDRACLWSGTLSDVPASSTMEWEACENGGSQKVAWGTATGFIDGATVRLDDNASEIRSAVGLGAANLDQQLDALAESIEDVSEHLDGQDVAVEDLSDDIAAVSQQVEDKVVELDPVALEQAIRAAIGDGVMISDASASKLMGTVVRFVFPAWNGTGFDKPFTCGASYLGSLRPFIPVKNWKGSQEIADASITFTGVRVDQCEASGFSFSIAAGNVVTEGDTDTIYVPLTDSQTLSVSPGLYRCDINFQWSNGEKFSLFPDGFATRFRAMNRVS